MKAWARFEFVAVWLVSALFTFAWFTLSRYELFTRDSHVFQVGGVDHRHYLSMAEGQGAIAPFCWRIGNPFLASLFADKQLGFMVITFLWLTLLGVATFSFIRKLTHQRGSAWIAVGALYAMYWVVGFNSQDFWLTDSSSMAIIMIACAFLVHRKLGIAIAVATVGALFREVTPLLFAFIALAIELKPRALLYAVPGLVLALAVRLAIPGHQALSVADAVKSHLADAHGLSFLYKYLVAPLSALGIAVVLIEMVRTPRLRIFLIYGVAVMAQLLLASDTERLLAYAFPIVLIALGLLVDRIEQTPQNLAMIGGMLMINFAMILKDAKSSIVTVFGLLSAAALYVLAARSKIPTAAPTHALVLMPESEPSEDRLLEPRPRTGSQTDLRARAQR